MNNGNNIKRINFNNLHTRIRACQSIFPNDDFRYSKTRRLSSSRLSVKKNRTENSAGNKLDRRTTCNRVRKAHCAYRGNKKKTVQEKTDARYYVHRVTCEPSFTRARITV